MQPNLLKFYLNDENEHPNGYTPNEMTSIWLDVDFERTHDWVQWAFPLAEGSKYNPDAPLLTQRTIGQLHASRVAQKNINDMLWRVIDFYDRTTGWMEPHDHNHLRITRIIKSLALITSPMKALLFYHFIMWRIIGSPKGARVNAQSVAMWKAEVDKIHYQGSMTATEASEKLRREQAAAQEGAI